MFYTARPKSKFPGRFLKLYFGLAVSGLIFLLGFYIGGAYGKGGAGFGAHGEGGEVTGQGAIPPHLLQDVDFDLLWEVWNIAKEKYLEQPVLDTQLFYGALSGIVSALNDPYSVFLDPALTARFTAELNGTFEGIGAEIGIKKEQLVIVAPLPDTPAARAGLRSGDAILKIGALDTSGMPLDLAVSNIRGAKGTTVKLLVSRGGWDEPREFSIVRETINVKSVNWKSLENDLGYIKLVYFNETTPELFEQAIRETLAKNPKGLILDLRNNPGGLLEVGVRVASQWVTAPDAVVIQETQDRVRMPFPAEGSARFKGIPTVVLVNQGSASAAEIVAGALQDYGLARLVGEKTFGKGSVQTFEQLPGGSSIKLTIAHWLTPKGRQIDKVGIAPDLEVKMTRDDYENEKDPQLLKAVELLSSGIKN